jgi:hypothetical protein
VENKTGIMQHVFKKQYIFLLPEYENKSLGGFSYVHLHLVIQVFKLLQGTIKSSVSICI